MKITITVTDEELAVARTLAAVGKIKTPLKSIMAAIVAGSAGTPAKTVKTTAKAGLWRVLGRLDLKTQLIPATVVQIAKETIVAYWRMADGAPGAKEVCAHCLKVLGTERLTIVGQGADIGLKLAHKPCGMLAAGLQDEPEHLEIGGWEGIRYLTIHHYTTAHQRQLTRAELDRKMFSNYGENWGKTWYEIETAAAKKWGRKPKGLAEVSKEICEEERAA